MPCATRDEAVAVERTLKARALDYIFSELKSAAKDEDEPQLDMSRADRFLWKEGDFTIIPPPPGDRTEEMYKDVDFRQSGRSF
jgi:hypothetical protein